MKALVFEEKPGRDAKDPRLPGLSNLMYREVPDPTLPARTGC